MPFPSSGNENAIEMHAAALLFSKICCLASWYILLQEKECYEPRQKKASRLVLLHFFLSWFVVLSFLKPFSPGTQTFPTPQLPNYLTGWSAFSGQIKPLSWRGNKQEYLTRCVCFDYVVSFFGVVLLNSVFRLVQKSVIQSGRTCTDYRKKVH